MADRVIRDELLQSPRFEDLTTDTDRIVFVGCILIADDFGNFEGGARRLYRWMLGFSQVKTETDSIKIMSDLADVDLARRYEVEGREFWHIPRFRAHRQYLTRRVPPSPWCNPHAVLGKTKRVIDRGLAKNVATTSQLHSSDVAEGVGVGVGVGEVPAAAPPPDPLWGEGLEVLTNANVSIASARSFIAKCLKDYAADVVLDALLEAKGTADPKPYTLTLLKAKPKKQGRAVDYTAGAV